MYWSKWSWRIFVFEFSQRHIWSRFNVMTVCQHSLKLMIWIHAMHIGGLFGLSKLFHFWWNWKSSSSLKFFFFTIVWMPIPQRCVIQFFCVLCHFPWYVLSQLKNWSWKVREFWAFIIFSSLFLLCILLRGSYRLCVRELRNLYWWLALW